ncbi:hypothetical protein ElyMa_003771800 [Elysia marginata]|uniref:Uncharacterized protein n=1 Tax=Elysia marginata TaxID=1093978 RepID=A0AAV4FC40_9GAST|nr:hypothetical protein ElyMa_003771800 [Elysia marginata]
MDSPYTAVERGKLRVSSTWPTPYALTSVISGRNLIRSALRLLWKLSLWPAWSRQQGCFLNPAGLTLQRPQTPFTHLTIIYQAQDREV